MQEVRFKTRYGSYNGGEVAGFADAEAADLVARGIAVPYAKPGKPAGKPASSPAKPAAAPVATPEKEPAKPAAPVAGK